MKLLSNTSKESIMIYEYEHEGEMTEGQQLLIDMAFKILAYIQQNIHPDIEALCWQILSILLKRGEFALINIGFNREEKEKILHNNIT